MPLHENALANDYWRGRGEAKRFNDYLDRLDETHKPGERDEVTFAEVGELLGESRPFVYFTDEFYDKEGQGIKGGGGLGILAGDTRRVAERLGIPFVTVTGNYPIESHQEVVDGWSKEFFKGVAPEDFYQHMGHVAIATTTHPSVELQVYGRADGSTKTVTIFEEKLGQLYHGNNSSTHRLYQQTAIGFGGYRAIRELGIEAPIMQLNEAPTVFAAIAHLDHLVSNGKSFEEAFEEVRGSTLYTNHTLVQAVESEFGHAQFEDMVMPNIQSEEVKDWIRGMIGQFGGRLRLSSLAVELCDVKSGVSELHARVSGDNYYDRNGNNVEFQAVTNGVNDRWILPEMLEEYARLGILDKFGLTTSDYKEKLEGLDIAKLREIRAAGRNKLNEILADRKDHNGEPIIIPDDAFVFDFKRRFVKYKRAEMVFGDIDELAWVLEEVNGYILIAGKPHPNDDQMVNELHYLIEQINEHPVLKDRVKYIQDYDEKVGLALSVGADCAINIPVVGQEACGTSWEKDIVNGKLLISTPDGGVADVDSKNYYRVTEPDELSSLYECLHNAAKDYRNDDAYLARVIGSMQDYMPTISDARMMGGYLDILRKMEQKRRLGNTASSLMSFDMK